MLLSLMLLLACARWHQRYADFTDVVLATLSAADENGDVDHRHSPSSLFPATGFYFTWCLIGIG
jgi:hypothetical protein